MKNVIYADVLFFINFGMDLISVWLTFLICHKRVNAFRLFLSASVGGLYGVISVVAGLQGFISLILSVAVGFLMVVIASPGKAPLSSYIKNTVILWGIGALCGGLLTLICSIGNGTVYGFRTHNAPFFLLAACSAAAALIVRITSAVKSVKRCEAVLTMFGKTYRLDMMADSGNLVREPVSGAPVAFVSYRALGKDVFEDAFLLTSGISSFDQLSPEVRRRVRIVCIKGINGASAALSVIPDKFVVLSGREEKEVRAVIVIDKANDFDGCDGILPTSLL